MHKYAHYANIASYTLGACGESDRQACRERFYWRVGTLKSKVKRRRKLLWRIHQASQNSLADIRMPEYSTVPAMKSHTACPRIGKTIYVIGLKSVAPSYGTYLAAETFSPPGHRRQINADGQCVSCIQSAIRHLLCLPTLPPSLVVYCMHCFDLSLQENFGRLQHK